MKRFVIGTSVCILLLTMCFSAFAHSGRTDSKGGHWDYKNNEYHYHPDDSSSLLWLNVGLFCIGGFVLFGWYVVSVISESLPHNVVTRLEYAIDNYKNAKKYVESCYNELQEIKKKAITPEGYEIGNDGLPKEINSTDWGKSLTVYTVYDGWKLHLVEGCELALCKRHIYKFKNKRHSFCKKCADDYIPPNLNWYVEYLKLAPAKNKYENAQKSKEQELSRVRNCYSDSQTKMAKFFFFFSKKNKEKLRILEKQYHEAAMKKNKQDFGLSEHRIKQNLFKQQIEQEKAYIEDAYDCLQNPKWHKPPHISIDEYQKMCYEAIEIHKNNIARLESGDEAKLNELIREERGCGYSN